MQVGNWCIPFLIESTWQDRVTQLPHGNSTTTHKSPLHLPDPLTHLAIPASLPSARMTGSGRYEKRTSGSDR